MKKIRVEKMMQQFRGIIRKKNVSDLVLRCLTVLVVKYFFFAWNNIDRKFSRSNQARSLCNLHITGNATDCEP